MRIFIWITVVLIGVNMLLYGDMAINNFDEMKIKYKRALDAGTYAGAKYRYYGNDAYMENIANGLSSDVMINKEECLKWFYRIFYRNINVDHNEYLMKELKKYIILKAVITYDTLYIADLKDNWTEIKYDIEYNGKQYNFTLSNEIYDSQTGKWMKDYEINLEKEKRQELLTAFVKEQINNFLNLREVEKNKGYYYVDFGLTDMDFNSKISGINFVAFVEGMPIPAFHLNKNNKFYAISFSGAEIRKVGNLLDYFE